MSTPARDHAELFVGADTLYYVHIKAGNGEIIFGSEGYLAKRSALDLLREHYSGVPVVDLTVEPAPE